MFPKMRSIESSFQYIRAFTIVVVISSAASAGFIGWYSLRMAERAQEKVYIISCEKMLEAVPGNRKENIPVEARNHISSFHQLFFTLAPDEKMITDNITRALYLADASAKRVYENLKENGYYANIISGNINQDVKVDSIVLDMRMYPFHFRCYATQTIIRPTSQAIRNLVTEGWLRNTSRSDNNWQGFLIERWSIIDNSDRKVELR
jgi:conjugative transposon TraK protein